MTVGIPERPRSETPDEVVEAVRHRHEHHRRQEKFYTELLEESQRQAEHNAQEATGHKAKAEACEKWLADNA